MRSQTFFLVIYQQENGGDEVPDWQRRNALWPVLHVVVQLRVRYAVRQLYDVDRDGLYDDVIRDVRQIPFSV